MRVKQTYRAIKLEKWQAKTAGGAIRLVSSQKNKCLSQGMNTG
jgi:hypothetical protein